MTGPMYITSEARMKRERVRGKKDRKKMEGRSGMGTNNVKRTDLRY